MCYASASKGRPVTGSSGRQGKSTSSCSSSCCCSCTGSLKNNPTHHHYTYSPPFHLTTSNYLMLFILLLNTLNTLQFVHAQFRNDQDPEYYRHIDRSRQNNRGWSPYTTPPNRLGSYSSGDTYYGTNRRYGTYDRNDENRGFDNKYPGQSNMYTEHLRYGGGRYLTQSMYDSRGRLRPGYEDRKNQLDADGFDTQIGVLDHWRPDLQGEQRPGKIPGVLPIFF